AWGAGARRRPAGVADIPPRGCRRHARGAVVVGGLNRMRIAVIGTRGTLGRTLCRQVEAAGHELVRLDRPEHDLTNHGAITEAITSSNLDVVIDPAAYTNVDGAESDPDAAFAVNGLGTRNVALASVQAGVPL